MNVKVADIPSAVAQWRVPLYARSSPAKRQPLEYWT